MRVMQFVLWPVLVVCRGLGVTENPLVKELEANLEKSKEESAAKGRQIAKADEKAKAEAGKTEKAVREKDKLAAENAKLRAENRDLRAENDVLRGQLRVETNPDLIQPVPAPRKGVQDDADYVTEWMQGRRPDPGVDGTGGGPIG
ncbi:MAG: hypothetical protein C0501_06580 [Isosphaera sp.]|nr:hypothetical protein [Isosphaera sp.]